MLKKDFADHIGVSAGRVSQMIKAGQIGRDSLHGTGRNAKIIVEKAVVDLSNNLDISQRLGNGIDTRLDGVEVPLKTGPKSETTENQIKAEKLKASRLNNERLVAEARLRHGLYVNAADAQAEMAALAGTILKIFEGGLAALADKVASVHKIPAQDVRHTLHLEFNEVRSRVQQEIDGKLEALPEFIEDTVDGDLSEEPTTHGT